MATKNATIQVVLEENGEVSMYLDGKETHSQFIGSEQEFIDFLDEIFSEYSWWIGEAWRLTLDEIEHSQWADDDDEDSSLENDND